MRIRTIKPQFWTSEDIAAIPDLATRLLFIGLWSYVDDNGVGLDDHRLIAGQLFPLEEDQTATRTFIREGLATLARVPIDISNGPLITRYVAGGKRYLHITTWGNHQRVDRPGTSRYPLPPEKGVPVDGGTDAAVLSIVATPSRAPRDTPLTGEGEKGRRGEGEKDVAPRKRGTRLPEDWQPSNLDLEWLRKEGISGAAARRSTEKFRDHWRAAAGPNASKLDWSAAWKNWLRNDADRSRPRETEAPSYTPWGGA